MSARRAIACRRALCTAVLVTSLISSGCWDRRETNTLAIVSSVGVDRLDNGHILLTAAVAEAAPSAGSEGATKAGGGQTKAAILQAEGISPFDALAAMTRETGRHPLLSHQKVLIVGRSLAEAGVDRVLDNYLRDPEPRETIKLLVSADSAAAVLASSTPLASGPSLGLAELLERQTPASEAAVVDLLDFVNMSLSDGAAGYAPMIELVRDPQGSTIARLSGTAVFVKNRLVGTLNQMETRGLMWLRDRETLADLTVPGEGGSPRATLSVVSARTSVRAHLDGAGPRIEVTVSLDTNLRALEQPGTMQDESDVDELQAAAAMAVRDEIQAAIAAAKRMHADIFDFGGAFRRSFRHEWPSMSSRWPDEFSQLEAGVQVKVRMKRFGIVLRSTSGS